VSDKHPLRCETCDYHDRFSGSSEKKGNVCQKECVDKTSLKGLREILEDEYDGIQIRGCASHSSYKSTREKVIDDIITLLYLFPDRVERRRVVDEINGYRMLYRQEKE
jgi:hypothetical protein